MPKTKAKKTVAAEKKPVAKPAVVAAPVKTTIPTSKMFGGHMSAGPLLAEFVGTLMLTAVVLVGSGSPLIAAMAVIVLVVMFVRVSGGHFNPAVTIGLLLAKQIPAWKAAGFVVMQVLGALLALAIVNKFITTGTPVMDPSTGEAMTHAFAVRLPDGHWEQFFAEMFGALLFGLGIGSIAFGKKQGVDAGIAAGLALFAGLVVATLGSAAVLNPAVALSVSAYTSDGWTWLAYAVGPIVGMTIGIWLFKLMQWDTTERKA